MIVGVIIDVMIRQNDAYESEEMEALAKILKRIESVEENLKISTTNLQTLSDTIEDKKELQTSADIEDKND